MHSTAWASYREAPFSASRRILHCSFEQKKSPVDPSRLIMQPRELFAELNLGITAGCGGIEWGS